MRVARVLVEAWMGGYSLVVKWGVTEDDLRLLGDGKK